MTGGISPGAAPEAMQAFHNGTPLSITASPLAMSQATGRYARSVSYDRRVPSAFFMMRVPRLPRMKDTIGIVQSEKGFLCMTCSSKYE